MYRKQNTHMKSNDKQFEGKKTMNKFKLYTQKNSATTKNYLKISKPVIELLHCQLSVLENSNQKSSYNRVFKNKFCWSDTKQIRLSNILLWVIVGFLCEKFEIQFCSLNVQWSSWQEYYYSILQCKVLETGLYFISRIRNPSFLEAQ